MNKINYFVRFFQVTEERSQDMKKENQSDQSLRNDLNNLTMSSSSGSSAATSTMSPSVSASAAGNMSYSQQIQQQQAESSPISTQLNKMLKKTKKDNEKKMLLNDEDFNQKTTPTTTTTFIHSLTICVKIKSIQFVVVVESFFFFNLYNLNFRYIKKTNERISSKKNF